LPQNSGGCGEAAGLTCDDVAARLDCSASKISRIETGRVAVLFHHLQAVALSPADSAALMASTLRDL
jgi:Helix-turn-helix domain